MWKKKNRKIYTTSLHEPTGYKERVGESLKRLKRWTGEREKQTSVALPATSLPFLAPPPPSLHHLASGGWTTALDGGASVLSVLPRCLWVYYWLSLPWRSPAASHSLRLSHTRKNTNTRTSTQALRSIWTLFTLCSLSSSYVGLFVAAVPELGGGELGRTKWRERRKKKKDGEKRTEVVVVEEVVKGGDEWERKRGEGGCRS